MSGHKMTTLRINRLVAAQVTQARMMAALRDAQSQPRIAALHRENAAAMEAVFRNIEQRQVNFEESLQYYPHESVQDVEQETSKAMHAHQETLFSNLQLLMNQYREETTQALFTETANLESQHAQETRRHNDLVQSLANDYQESLDELAGQQQNVAEQQNQLEQVFQQNQEQIRSSFLHMHAAQEDLAYHQQQILEQLDAFSEQHQRYSHTEADKLQHVQEQLEEATILADVILNTYTHDKFSPGQMQQWLAELEHARNNLALGFLDAALLAAQHTYQRLSELRLFLQQQQGEWELLLQSLRNRLRELRSMAQSLAEVPSTDLDGNEIGEMIDVDFWSGRKLSRITSQILHLWNQLDGFSESLSFDDLLNMQDSLLPSLHRELQNACQLAVVEALNSQLRVNIADVVIQALESEGYRLTAANYENQDIRKSFQTTTKNLAGNEVKIELQSRREEKGSIQLHLMNYVLSPRPDYFLKKKSKAIIQSLQRFGIEVGEIQTLVEDPLVIPPRTLPSQLEHYLPHQESE